MYRIKFRLYLQHKPWFCLAPNNSAMIVDAFSTKMLGRILSPRDKLILEMYHVFGLGLFDHPPRVPY